MCNNSNSSISFMGGAPTPGHSDIQDQGVFDTAEGTINQANNYEYNAIGQLVKDKANQIDTIIWTQYGKVWKVKKHNGDSLIFAYNVKGDRILKMYKPLTGNPVSTYYVYDGQADIVAVYTKEIVGSSVSFELSERNIYGKIRIGIDKSQVQLVGAPPYTEIDTLNRYLGTKEYELDNYIGNVLVVVTDRKIPRPNSAGDSINHYEADILSSNDYYAFGMYEPGRNFSSSQYRYGYNRKEKIDEIYGEGDVYDFGDRMLDPRLGKWLSLDPSAGKSPFKSPYMFALDNPIIWIDPDGNTEFYDNNGNWIGTDGNDNSVRSIITDDNTATSILAATSNGNNYTAPVPVKNQFILPSDATLKETIKTQENSQAKPYSGSEEFYATMSDDGCNKDNSDNTPQEGHSGVPTGEEQVKKGQAESHVEVRPDDDVVIHTHPTVIVVTGTGKDKVYNSSAANKTTDDPKAVLDKPDKAMVAKGYKYVIIVGKENYYNPNEDFSLKNGGDISDYRDVIVVIANTSNVDSPVQLPMATVKNIVANEKGKNGKKFEKAKEKAAKKDAGAAKKDDKK
ncbi:MAG: RHS repeat domain-containing protein [Bacteroidia bacterium]